jgi:hypothetical protein
MRRIFISAALVLASVGCTLTSPANKEVTAYDLQVYGSYQFGKTVAMPTGLLNAMIDFDAYLAKSDTEKLLDENFYGNVTFFGEDTYHVSHRSAGVYCTVNTGGKSILEKDAQWNVTGIGYNEFYGDMSVGVSLDVFVEGESTIEKVADSTWVFNSEGIESTMTKVKQDSLYFFNVEGNCIDHGDNGLEAVSATEEGGVNVWRIEHDSGNNYKYTTLSYSGTFTTEIYMEDNQIDFCRFAFKPGFNSSITTSRD